MTNTPFRSEKGVSQSGVFYLLKIFPQIRWNMFFPAFTSGTLSAAPLALVLGAVEPAGRVVPVEGLATAGFSAGCAGPACLRAG